MYISKLALNVACVQDFLADGGVDPRQLAQQLLEVDDHGLLGWCLGPVGVRMAPFAELHRNTPQAWAVCVAVAQRVGSSPAARRLERQHG
ncbi:hypothetical protein YS110_09050 [Acidovorax sp. YS12]|jgi:hypothetical protein|nr:hypothetical protein YS110_09050 [Acidovorax sp. YS12]